MSRRFALLSERSPGLVELTLNEEPPCVLQAGLGGDQFPARAIVCQCCFERSAVYGAGNNFCLSETGAHCDLLLLCMQLFKGLVES